MGAIPRFRSVGAGALASGLAESSSFALFAGGPSIGVLSDALLVVSYMSSSQWLCLRGCEEGRVNTGFPSMAATLNNQTKINE